LKEQFLQKSKIMIEKKIKKRYRIELTLWQNNDSFDELFIIHTILQFHMH